MNLNEAEGLACMLAMSYHDSFENLAPRFGCRTVSEILTWDDISINERELRVRAIMETLKNTRLDSWIKLSDFVKGTTPVPPDMEKHPAQVTK